MYGLIVADILPLAFIGLMVLLVILVRRMNNASKKFRAVRMVNQAKEAAEDEEYERAHELYMAAQRLYPKQQLVSDLEMGRLCRKGKNSDWSLRGQEASAAYWFEKTIHGFGAEGRYEYGLYLVEDSDDPMKAAQGVEYIRKAAQWKYPGAQETLQRLEADAEKAMQDKNITLRQPWVTARRSFWFPETLRTQNSGGSGWNCRPTAAMLRRRRCWALRIVMGNWV